MMYVKLHKTYVKDMFIPNRSTHVFPV